MPSRLSPLFSWLADWRPDEFRGTLTDIYVAAAAGAAMRRVAEVRAIAGAGLEGDRYASGSGHWRHTDACEVTLVDAADLERAQRKSGIGFAAGEHRRNLVVSGIPLDAYRNRRVRIGEVLLEFHRLRPPCGHLDRLLARGAGKALGKGAGIGLRVIEGGVLRVGDRVQVLDRGADPG
jgi:MOSC domain-containing protein YiiM